MENPLCSNGNISSAPVPYVGLYITGATLVCLLLILYDLFLSFRHKRPYLPCKLFSVNSATLTLLAITSKLPVDLTTNMPSASDQITKLTGIIMVCVSMAFMMPSMGTNRKAESISNMIALSLFVVTIVVNICIQLRTGVIFSFFWEHILISCFMVIMLAVFLHSTNNINAAKIRLAGNNRSAFRRNVTSSSVDKVMPWYKSSSVSNPQFVLCKDVLSSTSSGMICIICLVVLSQVVYRSLIGHKMKFCNEKVSDYGWSIPMILVTQIITIVVASLATAYRWFVMVIYEEISETQLNIYMYIKDTETLAFKFLAKYKKFPMKKISLSYASLGLFKSMVSLVYVLVFFTIVSIPFYLYRFILHGTRSLKGRTAESSSISRTSRLKKKMERICEKEMNTWIDAMSKNSPPTRLVEVLRRRNRDLRRISVSSIDLTGLQLSSDGFYKSSCLSLVIVARVITLLLPSDRANLLTQALDEAFELLYYIDQKTNIKDAEDEVKHELAKIILENNKDVVNISGYDNAMLSVDDEYEFFRYSKPAKFEMDIIKKFLQDYNSRRIHAMYEDLEEAFICSLYDFLYQLPDTVIKEVEESPIEEQEERARVVAKLVCKYKLLDDVLNYGLRMTPWES